MFRVKSIASNNAIFMDVIRRGDESANGHVADDETSTGASTDRDASRFGVAGFDAGNVEDRAGLGARSEDSDEDQNISAHSWCYGKAAEWLGRAAGERGELYILRGENGFSALHRMAVRAFDVTAFA